MVIVIKMCFLQVLNDYIYEIIRLKSKLLKTRGPMGLYRSPFFNT